jgi:NodT family efflux transporter outer membrane factor (OMF) lipoprotein
MKKKTITIKLLFGFLLISGLWACKVPALNSRTENKTMPTSYSSMSSADSVARINWRNFFTDPHLAALIDTALQNNQELNILLHEIAISKNEIRARKGEYLPFVNIGAAAGFEKEGRFTRHGAVDESIEMKPGKEIPKVLPDYYIGLNASWELDVWKKLRNARQSAILKYLSTNEGRNFMVTQLIAEIAVSYYELMALDNQLDILQQNSEIQRNALQIVRMEKEAAKVTQLAVNRFEAQLLHTQNLQYEIRQRIVETENRINFLVGRYPQPIIRNSNAFAAIVPTRPATGLPSQILSNRPDIRQAELDIQAARLDVNVARANFYPSFRITAGTGLRAFNPAHLVKPESILYNLAGDMIAPLVNKNAIRAAYATANEKQIQAVFTYERSVLNAYLEVVNQLNRLENFSKSYETKAREAEILAQSVNISNNLFRSARADYVEVLLTQREALEAKMELTEIKLRQLAASVNMYKALGGGWE